MDEDEKKLIDLFAQKQDLVSQEPTYAAAFSPPPEQLEEGRRRARALFNQGPEALLPEAQRGELSGARFPEIQGIADLLAQGLARHPEITREIAVTPALFQRALGLDRALGRFVWAGQLHWHGGESGELLTGAAAQGLCQAALSQAASRRTDPSLTAGQRGAVTTFFTEPSRIDKAQRDRQAQAAQRTLTVEEPYRDEIGRAEESAQMARVIEEFLAFTRREA